MKAFIRRWVLGEQPETIELDQVGESEGPKETGEAAELAPRDENEYRHQYPMLRLMSVVVLLSLALNISLAGALLWMFPLLRVEPYILQVHPDGQMVVQLQPLRGANLPSSEVVVKGIIERYIIEREEVIEIEGVMRRRWTHQTSYIANHTAGKLYKAFKKVAEERLKSIQRQPYRRTVELESIISVSDDTWIYKAQFKVESSLGQIQRSTIDIKFYEATIELVRSSRRERNIKDAMRNPFGFYVVGYDLREQRRTTQAGKLLSTELGRAKQ